MGVITWIIANARIVIGCLGLLVVTNALTAFGVYLKGHANGYTQAQNECNAGKVETINENIKIIDKSKDIKRPSDIAYRERLLQFTKD
jgi:hypothetical protein